MIFGNFEKDRKVIDSIYSAPDWDAASGVSQEALLEGCLEIEKKTEGLPRIITKSEMFKFVLENAQLDVREEDFFPERLRHDRIIARIRDRWIRALRRYTIPEVLAEHEAAQEGLCYTGNLDLGHCAPDWHAIFNLGIPGLIDRVKKAAEKSGLSEEQTTFYSSCITVLEATRTLIIRLADKAKSFGSERSELISRSLCNISKNAPQNTLEAMQLLMIFYNLQTHVEGEPARSVGGLDRLFYPFYKKDIENGTFTDREIRELFRYFFFKFYSMKITANVPFYLGGRLPDGSSGVNELSYLIVEEYTSLDINDPKIHVRWYNEIPKDFVCAILESIRNGRNSFVFVNDNVIESALVGIGESKEDARNYIIIGCYEPCALGKEIPCTCAGRVNMTKALLTVMTRGVDSYTQKEVGVVRADPDSYKTFDEFFDAVKAQIASFCDSAMNLVRAYEDHYPTVSQAPLLSSTFAPCIESGRDAYDHGAKYCNSSIVAFSVATTTDALLAVKKLVYEEKVLTLSEFAEILENNWEGHESLRRKVLRTIPKYGNGHSEPDSLAKELVDFAASCVNGKEDHRGGVFRLGLFSIDYRITFGERTGATPDGRAKGDMLSKNMCAVTAMDKEGVTAMIKSATEVDFTKVPDGTVLDIMLHKSAAEGEAGIGAMYALVMAYMQRNGFAIQINVLSPDVLRAAQKEPDKYATLQVRLCGWNVYFVELTKAEQDELIIQCENAER